MSKVIVLTDRTNPLKIEENKRLLFKSRLNMSSSHRKNLASLSIPNSQLNINKKSLIIKEKNKFSNKKEKVNPYTHKKNITYINGNNGNNNHLKDRNFNFKYFNSTFNNFSKNLKHDIINNNYKKEKEKETNKNYYSNKTFINKSLNNSVIGKSVFGGRKIKNFEKNKKRQKNELPRAKKKILSLSNSLTKSKNNKNKNKDYYKYYKKEFINKNIKKNIFAIRDNKYNNIKSENNPKLPNKDYKNNNKNKSITKSINNSYNIFGNKKFGKSEDNTRDSIGHINNLNKVKLQKVNINLKNSKEKKILSKYNKKNLNKNNNNKFYRNNLLITSKEINKTEINSAYNADKQKIIKDKNKNLVKKNIYNNKLYENKNHDFLEKEEIKVNKIDELYYFENSNLNKIINSGSDNLQIEEEEEEEDSNILSLDDVQDIIRYYDFSEIDKYDNNLFYRNDYKMFVENSKNVLLKEFFEESDNVKLIKNKKSEKNSNKKNTDNKYVNNYYKNIGISSPIHNINSDNKIYKTFKK